MPAVVTIIIGRRRAIETLHKIMENLIGLVAVTLIFGIPIVAIFSSHKRRMLEMQLLHGQSNQQSSKEMDSMRAELKELRERVNDQALVIEDMRSFVRNNNPLHQTQDLQDRLNS